VPPKKDVLIKEKKGNVSQILENRILISQNGEEGKGDVGIHQGQQGIATA
jgi:hypothetical protein